MEQILGIDLGTNSIGAALREGREFPWYGVYTFKKGVGEGKSGEFSFAAERTKNRSSRRLYNSRRYRIWATLDFLIKMDFCPLPIEKLEKWRKYSKESGRVFPVEDKSFQNWIKLDFNYDGKPDYSSPYQLRRELINIKLDLTEKINREKIGRALFHIAQRRGFKSSRKNGVNEKVAVYRGSSETGTVGRNEYEQLLIDHQSLGAAFAFLEDSGIRIRNRYTLRSDYENEVDLICMFQGLENDGFKDLIKKAIFFQRPLRSQKGLVGKCTLEPTKPRCPVSHPAFEEFRVWSFLNSIKYFDNSKAKWESLPVELKQDLFNEKFAKAKSDFKFSQIGRFLQKKTSKKWTLNYKDEATAPGSPVSAVLSSIFGENWQDINFSRTGEKSSKKKFISYGIDDIWHILFSFEDEEILEEFLSSNLQLSEIQVKDALKLWNSFPIGYSSLSLKAIRNMLPFLRDGLIYTEAVILAKIPEIIGIEKFEQNRVFIKNRIQQLIEENRKEKRVVSIVNKLISDYHLSDFKQGYKDTSYRLENFDLGDIEKAIIENFGVEAWGKEIDKEYFKSKVRQLYQSFFESRDRKHIQSPHLLEQLKQALEFEFHIEKKSLKKLYHPSQIDIYPPAKRSNDGKLYLPSPKTGAFKNPMAYKTLFQLRKVINHLIEQNKIDEETRIVVEIARDLNDSNKRWAIESYQKQRENENREIAFAISQLVKDPNFNGSADPESRTDKEKLRLWTEQSEDPSSFWKVVLATKDDVKKYRLWKEQNCKCIYTGKMIPFTTLFDKNIVHFEHTIPRSKSFDDSLANLTVCYADYNTNVKKNKLPYELPNFDIDTPEGKAIKPQLVEWEKKVESLYSLIEAAKSRSKSAMDKAQKDDAIRKKHILQMELDYWKNKLDRFTRKDLSTGFKNSQLIDTQIISKYAFHYLKTVFNRVDVQKGTVTSIFRKIYGIQPKEETKDRGKHYHHAIDAAVLTMIPKAAERDTILKKYFEDIETNKLKNYPILPFEGFSFKTLEDIKQKILINNIPDRDQAFSPARKIARKRGRIVWLRGADGKLILDKDGKKVPKIMDGDSVRGELHMKTFYAKNRIVERDMAGKPMRNALGDWQFKQGKDQWGFALRVPVESLSDLNSIVDPELARIIEKQLNGRSLKQAISDGIYMLDKEGKKINKIRRVRIWQAVDPLMIKEQTYKSNKDYKNYFYAKNSENFAFGYYLNSEGDYEIRSINLFEATLIKKEMVGDDFNNLFEKIIYNKKGKELKLFHVFKPGQRVIFYDIDKYELKGEGNFSNRLYFVKRLYQASRGNIQFQHHLEGRSDKQLLLDFPEEMIDPIMGSKCGKKGLNGFSKFSSIFVAPRLLLSPKNFNFIIEGRDFDILLDGKIRLNY